MTILKRASYMLILIGVLPFSGATQESQTKVDSIRNVLATTEPDTNHILLIRQLAKQSNKDTTRYYLEKALSMAVEMKANHQRMRILIDLGIFYNSARIQEKYEYFVRKRLALAQKLNSKQHESESYLDLGIALRQRGAADSSFHYFSLAEPWAKQNDTVLLSKVYLGKGRLYSKLSKAEEAKINLRKAYQLLKKNPDRALKGYALYLAAENAYFTNDFEGYAHYRREWDLFQKEKDQKGNWLRSDARHTSLINMFAMQDSMVDDRIHKAIVYYQANDRMIDAAISQADLFYYYKRTGQLDIALQHLQIADSLFQVIDDQQDRARLLISGYELSKEMGLNEQALAYLEEQVYLSDSLSTNKQIEAIQALETRLATKEKENQLAVQSLELKQKTLQRNALLLAILGLIAIAMALFYYLRQKMLLNRKLAEQEAEIKEERIQRLEQESRLTAYHATLSGQEVERQRIAQDLHDGLGGLLASVKNQFTQTSSTKDEESYTRTHHLIDEACSEVRRISHNMMPLALNLAGLGPALEDLTADLRKEKLQASLEIINPPKERMEAETELMVYRIIQELVHNIRKHAEAKSILIQLMYTSDQFQLLVEDDGKGFDLNQLDPKPGLGLSSINSRVKLLGGNIQWDSIKGQGTSVQIEIPLKQSSSKLASSSKQTTSA